MPDESGNQDVSEEKVETNRSKGQEPTAVNTEAITIAREMAGMTQTELAMATGFSQAKISRFEDGISQPSGEEVKTLANKLGQRPRFFYRSDVKRSVFNSFYRKRKSVSQKLLMQFNARVCVRQVQIDRLLGKVELESTPIPRFDPEDYQGGVKQVAAALRQLLKLPPGPVKSLIEPLEDIGVIIVMEDFGIPKLDGVSTFSNKGTPIIFLNVQAPPSRRRFSLAHEIAHTALHRYLAPDADEQADALAAELLMPENDIRTELAGEPLSLARLAELKPRWRVSMAALLFRAKTLELIEQRRYSYLWAQMATAGHRIREPYEELLEDEKPALEREIIEYHRDDLNYTTSELADSLDITEKEVLRRYNLHAELRVI